MVAITTKGPYESSTRPLGGFPLRFLLLSVQYFFSGIPFHSRETAAGCLCNIMATTPKGPRRVSSIQVNVAFAPTCPLTRSLQTLSAILEWPGGLDIQG